MSAPTSSRPVLSGSPEETHRLGVKLGQLLQPGDFVGLVGDLGAGKTHLVRGVAEGAGKNGLQAADGGLFVGQQAQADLLGDERVIGGELFEAAGAQAVGAAVADVRQAEPGAIDPRGDHGRSHAVKRGIAGGEAENRAVGATYRAQQAVRDRSEPRLRGSLERKCGIGKCLTAVFADRRYGNRAGNFAMLLAAHAVGKHE